MELDFKQNIGLLGRIIRAAVGMVLIFLILTKTLTNFWAIVGLITALVFFAEAYFSYCFVVNILRWPNTKKRNQKSK